MRQKQLSKEREKELKTLVLSGEFVIDADFTFNRDLFSPGDIRYLSVLAEELTLPFREYLKKSCSKCEEEKYFFEFNIDSSKEIPFQSWCIACQRQRNQSKKEYTKKQTVQEVHIDLTDNVIPMIREAHLPDDLVFNQDGKPMTSSLHLALAFDKNHDDVLKIIRQRKEEYERVRGVKGLGDFSESFYTNEQNKEQPLFYLTKKACHFVIMKFTGEKAIGQQLSIIDKFEAMEHVISETLNRCQNVQIKDDHDIIQYLDDKLQGIRGDFETFAENLIDIVTKQKRNPAPPENSRKYKRIVKEHYNGICPMCGKHRIVDEKGYAIKGMYHEHHIYDKNRNGFFEIIPICKYCNVKIGSPRPGFPAAHTAEQDDIIAGFRGFCRQITKNYSQETLPFRKIA